MSVIKILRYFDCDNSIRLKDNENFKEFIKPHKGSLLGFYITYEGITFRDAGGYIAYVFNHNNELELISSFMEHKL